MGKFFKSLGKGLAAIGKTALTNAIKNPRTTTAGVAGVIGAIGAIKQGGGADAITGSVIGLLGSVALILADDPSKDSNDTPPVN